MGTKAYFMISVADEFYQNGCEKAVRDLEAMPEVKAIEPVRGAFDLLVLVEAPVRVIVVANKIMAKEWVKRLNVLTVLTVPEGHPKPLREEPPDPELHQHIEEGPTRPVSKKSPELELHRHIEEGNAGLLSKKSPELEMHRHIKPSAALA